MLDPRQDDSSAAARGKVFFVAMTAKTRGDPDSFACYQVKGKKVDPVFCGNSTAAGAALHCEVTGRKSAALSVGCDGQAALAETTCVLDPEGWLVSQRWSLKPGDTIQETQAAGHRAVSCHLLNDYLVVWGPLQTDFESLIAGSGSRSTLRSKVAVIQAGDPLPKVHFLNCNGVHGAAPQTGLATLGLVASRVDWVADLVSNGQILTPGGIEEVPVVSEEAGGSVSMTLPTVRVTFRHLKLDS
jgi:hypothetical protein